ncbi:Coenzyme F420-dependent oxidoreductase [Rhodococcus sp. WAY2]|nr:Coenzyme F420-dependent oxidoreductase [Rhodococcus sp. WAY2]
MSAVLSIPRPRSLRYAHKSLYGRTNVRDGLQRSVDRVVRNDNCTGCGGCALVSSRITMTLGDDGYRRPVVANDVKATVQSSRREAEFFKAVCPGVRIVAPRRDGREYHPIFGSYVSAWQGWASDEETRYSGSSGGVLTALSSWLVTSGRRASVTASAADSKDPKLTRPVVLTASDDFTIASGSRYAPVSNMVAYDPYSESSVLVGKPCEVSAAARLSSELGLERSESPLLLSFFCAGTPSQNGTEKLVALMAEDPEGVSAVRYRGNGWPGDFTVTTASGDAFKMSYDESWGHHIGRDIQWRCKLCVDGTGGDSDIAVGDYWYADASGYPKFDNADGNSVILARTLRGHELLTAAASQGVVVIAGIDLDSVAKIQPLQVERKVTLVGRLLGRLVSGKRVPVYRGFGLTRLAMGRPQQNLRAMAGTAKRSISLRRWKRRS